jgi:CDP-diacylglycerol--serine O-phosphatidyltransferase
MTSDPSESVRTPDTASPPKKRLRLRLSMFPTMLTLGNMVCGVLALSYIADASGAFRSGRTMDAEHLLRAAGVLIFLGMVFDALDGRVARLTRSTTEFGGALDSLADVVSFGVAPALLTKTIIEQALGSAQPKVAFVTAGFYVVCATLRLARYNVEHEEPDQAVRHFVGLPTPGAAGVLAAVAICHGDLLDRFPLDDQGRAVAADFLRFGVLVGLGLLMVSRVPYVHFANRFLAGRRPIGFIALVALFVALALHFPWEYLLGGVFVLYAVSGPIAVIPRLVRGKKEEVVPELFE